MRDINSTFKQEKNAETNQPIALFTVYDYDSMGANLHLAESHQDVTFDGETYTAFPITYTDIAEQSQGQIDSVEVKLGNVSRLIQGYLEVYDLRGKKVSIKLVWANQLADTDAFIEDIYYIDNYSADQMNVVFTCTSRLDVLEVTLPKRLYSRNSCQWKFKDADTCKYVGPESTCNKTKQQCLNDYDNFINFGGHPSIPTRRIHLV